MERDFKIQKVDTMNLVEAFLEDSATSTLETKRESLPHRMDQAFGPLVSRGVQTLNLGRLSV